MKSVKSEEKQVGEENRSNKKAAHGRLSNNSDDFYLYILPTAKSVERHIQLSA